MEEYYSTHKDETLLAVWAGSVSLGEIVFGMLYGSYIFYLQSSQRIHVDVFYTPWVDIGRAREALRLPRRAVRTVHVHQGLVELGKGADARRPAQRGVLAPSDQNRRIGPSRRTP